MARKAANLSSWIRHALEDTPPRSKSLLVTIFGDSLLPSVPSIWLSELIDLLQPFQVNAQLVRTSCFRLAQEGWLQSQRDGRRSRYSLTASGRHRVEHAYRRVYETPARTWDGRWTVVMLNRSRSTVTARAALRRELEWEGFGLLAPGILIHPRAQKGSLVETLKNLKLLGDVVVLQAHDLKGIASRPVTALAEECWDCTRVASHYTDFLRRFQPVLPLLGTNQDCQIAFMVQTILVHEYRRAVLHDPRLPAALLPANWPGYAAYELCGAIYRETSRMARAHVLQQAKESRPKRLQPAPQLLRRFSRPGN